MELVPTVARGNKDPIAIQLDPAARRIANINTVAVTSAPAHRTIRVVGELSYDEGALKTLSAYVDGRLESMYADYTGVVVRKGDKLALVYSPRLYSSQVEFLLAKKAVERSRDGTLVRVAESSRSRYNSARQRLTELGMTSDQIEQLEKTEKANNRLHLAAPISGTVIEKIASEGQYVKEGQAIYKLADLTNLWLMLKLFPDDAAKVRFGQRVEAEVQSLPGKSFVGRVAFVDPNVDPKTRTVGIRVVIPNKDGLLRVGDYAKATITVPFSASLDGKIYDPELANKWISPRHPHVIESAAGKCRVCGFDLVPASQLGFTDEPRAVEEALVVPRHAVLMAGKHSVVYVETKPGRFEIRKVVLGPNIDDKIVILRGVERGEMVATTGNFLIDSQMQLAGNPSLIDPNKAKPTVAKSKSSDSESKKIAAALAKLSDEDRRLAESQVICPVTKSPLGTMGVPLRVELDGRPILVCCLGCREPVLNDPEKHRKILSLYKAKSDEAKLNQGKTAPSIAPPIGVPQPVDPHEASSDTDGAKGLAPPIATPKLLDEEAEERERPSARSDDRMGELVR